MTPLFLTSTIRLHVKSRTVKTEVRESVPVAGRSRGTGSGRLAKGRGGGGDLGGQGCWGGGPTERVKGLSEDVGVPEAGPTRKRVFVNRGSLTLSRSQGNCWSGTPVVGGPPRQKIESNGEGWTA